jgi:hypothetical protein
MPQKNEERMKMNKSRLAYERKDNQPERSEKSQCKK